MRKIPRAKYGNRRVRYQGMVFDSRGEWERYMVLRAMEQRGEISGLERQVRLTLQPAFTDNQGKRWRAIEYRPDFAYTQDGVWVLEDFKGVRTKEFDLKYKLLLFLLRDRPDVRVELSRT
jgi:hypothetical protein